ncbi:S-layer homology domain-containing protein, partial [Methanosarcina mazei]|uniref:S-layer homology domain-containing protein n=1 Tax=Methanosarcina mazei TaxID=2209 RepID=UPI00064E193C
NNNLNEIIATWEQLKKDNSNYLSELMLKFNDLKNHWASDYIAMLFKVDILKGYTDGTIKPNGTITRAEFIKMLITALHNDPGNSPTGHWAYNYMNEAQKQGYILEGELDDWNKHITRGELARLLIRALSLSEGYPNNMSDYTEQIKDYNDIPKEYQDYILKAFVTGIITGYEDGTFRYERTATRAEAATMLVRFLDSTERKIPELEPVDTSFIEPELSVYFYKSKDAYDYFDIKVDNMEDYERHDKYTFTTECVSHPEINYHDRYNIFDGSLLNSNVSMIERFKNKGIQPDGAIYRLDDLRVWKPAGSKKQFSPKEGELMKYKITVDNGEKTKEYFIELKFKYIEFRY